MTSTTESEFRERTILRTNDVPLTFTGKVLSFVSTNNQPNGKPKKRWTELTLYETESGKFVSESVGVSSVSGETDLSHAEVFSNLEDALNFFRNRDGEFTWVSMEMVKRASLTYPHILKTFGRIVD